MIPSTAATRPTLLFGGCALLVVATVLAYWPAFHGGFIFDDNVFLTENPLIHAPGGLARFWFSREATDYWPVTSTTLWLEWRCWGMNAAGYHATNVALHLATALLLWGVLRRLRVPGALVGALLFVVHPVNAESVTWITERKNLMAMLFFLLSIHGFVGERRWSYGLSLLAFVLAMLAKGSTVILPLVLLGIVAWHRRPTRHDAWRLAPFFAVAAGLALVESSFSTVLEAADMQPLSPLARLLRAGGIVWFYVGKTLWPAHLCFDYGPWAVAVGDWRWWIPLAAALGLTALLWRYRRTWSRPALFGWGYFCVALLPVLGFAEVGFMRYSPVSDHYAHLALLGACALAGAGWARLAAGTDALPGKLRRAVGLAAAAALIAGGTVLARAQCRIYADGVTLYRDTIARNPASWIALTNLGALLSNVGENDEAIVRLTEAVRLKPDFPESRNNLGLAFYRTGHLPEAIAHYEATLRVQPDFYRARNNLGAALARSGRLGEARAQFEEALRIDPDFAEARQNLDRAERLLREGAPPRSAQASPLAP